MHYGMPAVLTDWALFPGQVKGNPARPDVEDIRMVQYLSDHLPHASENYMMGYLAAAMGRASRPDTRSGDLIGVHGEYRPG
jgi:hypothetical protein